MLQEAGPPDVTTYCEANVGHTMDEQHYVSLHFTARTAEGLERGVTGSIELPWAWGAYGLKYEEV